MYVKRKRNIWIFNVRNYTDSLNWVLRQTPREHSFDKAKEAWNSMVHRQSISKPMLTNAPTRNSVNIDGRKERTGFSLKQTQSLAKIGERERAPPKKIPFLTSEQTHLTTECRYFKVRNLHVFPRELHGRRQSNCRANRRKSVGDPTARESAVVALGPSPHQILADYFTLVITTIDMKNCKEGNMDDGNTLVTRIGYLPRVRKCSYVGVDWSPMDQKLHNRRNYHERTAEHEAASRNEHLQTIMDSFFYSLL